MIRQPTFLVATAGVAPASPLFQAEPPLDRLINGLAFSIVLVIVALCLIGFVIVLVTLLPKVSERSKAAFKNSAWRAFFIGLANYLFLGGISLLLLSTEIPPLSVLGLVIAAFLIIVTAIGLPGLALLIGERLTALSGHRMSDLKQLIWATLLLELAMFLPFIGWFLLTPVLLMTSFGAAVLAWRNRKKVENIWEEGGPGDDH